MKYKDFEDAFSAARLNKYKNACSGNTNKALTLLPPDGWHHYLAMTFFGQISSQGLIAVWESAI